MFRFDSPPSLQLSRGDLITWRQTQGVRLEVMSGSLWVTRANDLDDHFLRPGDSLLLPHGVSALIGAEQDARVRFEPVESGSRRWLQRLSRWLRPSRHRLPSRRPVLRQRAATVAG